MGIEHNNLQVVINFRVDEAKEIKELVKIASEIQKEYSCNCTLFIKREF